MDIGNRNRRFLFAVLVAILALMVCRPALAETADCRIVIAKSWDLPEYNVALEGFSEATTKGGVKCEILTLDLQGRENNAGEITRQIQNFKPDVILTVGSRATGVVSDNFKDVPIVFSMVLYPVASEFVSSMDKPGKNLTGVAMDVPIEQQLRTLSRIVPNLKRVGVLYSSGETLPVIELATKVAKSLDMSLMAEQVESESDVPEALSRLEKQKIEALWSVADGKVFTRPSTRYIIKYVVRRGIPFMGPHNGFVKAGALIALTADYRDNGRQAGELTIKILKGANPKDIPIATPRVVDMALNLQVANHIRLKIPPTLLDEATQVFE